MILVCECGHNIEFHQSVTRRHVMSCCCVGLASVLGAIGGVVRDPNLTGPCCWCSGFNVDNIETIMANAGMRL
jgi:hypothetical protein